MSTVADPSPERSQPGPAPAPEITEKDLQGFAFVRRIREALAPLHDGAAAHPNRQLHYQEYATLVLFYYFNPALTSLRGLQRVSQFEKVQRVLGLRRMSLGSLSESAGLFDPELLARVFEEMAAAAPGRWTDPRLRHLGQVLTACDGSLFRALPRMAWAVWLRDSDRGIKAHVQFEVLSERAVKLDVTPGQTSEIATFRKRLAAGRLYVLDRGYRSLALLQAILQADSSFVVRWHGNAVYEVMTENELTEKARAAHVTFDAVVRLGCETARDQLTSPVRLVRLHVPAQAWRGGAYPVKVVDSKKTFRRSPGEAYDLWIVTDRLDLPADVIALIYQHRWKVELFFRLLKSVLRCRHLLSDSYEGVSIQLYAALIATLLLAEHGAARPSKPLFELVALRLQGWVSDDEFRAAVARLQPTKTA